MRSNPLIRLLRWLPLAALGAALAGTAAPPLAEAGPKIAEPFLWNVQGTTQPSYLFGTIHAGVSANELPPRVGQAIAQSDLFIMETAPERGMLHPGKEAPMDLELANHAHRTGGRILTLETLRFQLDLLSKLGSREEIAAMLAEDAAAATATAPLMKAYRSGNEDRLLAEARSPDPAMQELLLDSRNRRWAKKLAPVLERGGAFVAVGAGHLPGEQGLVTLLRERGFIVERA